MRRARRAIAVLLMAMLVTAGCGSDDEATEAGAPDAAAGATEGDSGSTAPDVPSDTEPGLDGDGADAADELDVCGLLAEVDLEPLLGEPAGPLEGESDALGHVCAIDPLDEESRATLRLVVSTSSGPENYATQREMLGVDAEVTGLGDEAFHSGPYLVVVRGDALITLQAISDASQAFRVADADLETAMASILAALPA